VTDSEEGKEKPRFEVRTTAESHFSWLRTRMSVERTLMSWVRTATALIGFGFTIFQFLSRFNETAGVEVARHPFAPWFLSLGLIGTGIVALIIAVQEYRMVIRYLWDRDFKSIAGVNESYHYTPVVAVSLVLILIGVFAFVAVFLRV
jgi:putative membrane protein